MTIGSWRRIFINLARFEALYLSLLLVGATLVVVSQFPIYFRADDIIYIEWAHNHSTPLAAFEELILGTYRPVLIGTWWFLYRLFALNPMPYQAFVLLAYGSSLIFYFKLVETVFSRRVAVFSLAAYSAVFFYLGYIVFWFSDLTYIVELFFMNLSLYLLIRAIKGEGSLFWGALSYVFATLSKEPAIIIVPAVAAFYLLSEWGALPVRRRKQSAGVIGGLLVLGLTWGLSHPTLQHRQGIDSSLGISGMITFLSQRWSFYSDYLVSELGILIWISAFYLALRYLLGRVNRSATKSFYVPLTLSILTSLVVRPFPDAALLLLVVAFIPVIAKRARESVAIVWFTVPLLGVMTISYMVRTYLVEASFGIAILMGAALDDILSNIVVEWRRIPSKSLKNLLAISSVIGVLGFGAVGFAPRVRPKLDALYVVSASRQNLEAMVEYVGANLNDPGTHLVVIDYEDMGLSHVDDILPLSDLEKAHRQKTMDSGEIQRLLRVVDRQNVLVHNLGWAYENCDVDQCFLLAMNNYERAFVDGTDLRKVVVYRVERSGEGAWIYRLVT